MTTAEIQAIQVKIGTEPDGWFGPKSQKACRKHLRGLMPDPHPFPIQSKVTQFYGPHGDPPTKKILLPFTIYYEGTPKTELRPHEKCADSLLRVFNRLARVYPDERSRRMAGLLNYGGLFNNRRMRGGQAWSMHAWAIAIDLDVEHNGFRDNWPNVAHMPLEVMECFALEGWTSAGGDWFYDAQHFQATNPG